MIRSLFFYRVEIADSTGIIGKENKFEVSTVEVIGENDRFVVINDFTFTTISKADKEYYTVIGKPGIFLNAGDKVWGNRIQYTLYSESPKRAKTIKKEIESAVMKKYGFFMQWVDLSIVTDAKTTPTDDRGTGNG